MNVRVDKKLIAISDAAAAAGGGGRGGGASDTTRLLSLQPSRRHAALVQRNLRPGVHIPVRTQRPPIF